MHYRIKFYTNDMQEAIESLKKGMDTAFNVYFEPHYVVMRNNTTFKIHKLQKDWSVTRADNQYMPLEPSFRFYATFDEALMSLLDYTWG